MNTEQQLHEDFMNNFWGLQHSNALVLLHDANGDSWICDMYAALSYFVGKLSPQEMIDLYLRYQDHPGSNQEKARAIILDCARDVTLPENPAPVGGMEWTADKPVSQSEWVLSR